MSEAPKKTISLVNQLNRRLQWRRLWSCVGSVLTIGFSALIGWCLAAESVLAGGIVPGAVRTFTFPGEGTFLSRLKGAIYSVLPADGAPYRAVLGPFLHGLLWTLAVLAALLLLSWLLSFGEEKRKLRRFLKPIDDIALSAERIARHAFDPGKLAPLTDAISRVNAPETRISVDDEDLAGLGAAVNNMLKRVEESARQQMRFVDDASHELRTPIAVIQGYINMLDRWGKDDPKVLAESIQAISTEAEHMKTLVEQLLFLARGDMGRTTLKKEQLSLSALLTEIRDESVMIDEAHRYKLDIDCARTASADPAMLKQAVRILVDNAAKYTAPGGDIRLRLREGAEGESLLEVEDSGIGIAKNDAPRVFDRFYRADPARQKSGSGLGLSIARWIVEQHGGHIRVQSFPDVGTRMTICLPGAQADETAGAAPVLQERG